MKTRKPFKCKFCAIHVFQKGDLNKHIISVHEKKKPFKCEFGGKNFSHKSHLNRHITSVHENVNFVALAFLKENT